MGNLLAYLYPQQEVPEEIDSDSDVFEGEENREENCYMSPMDIQVQAYFEVYQKKYTEDKAFAIEERKKMNTLQKMWKTMDMRTLVEHADWVTQKTCALHTPEELRPFFEEQLAHLQNHTGAINATSVANIAKLCNVLGMHDEWKSFWTQVQGGRWEIESELLL